MEPRLNRQDFYGNTALCTIMHRAVKTQRWLFMKALLIGV